MAGPNSGPPHIFKGWVPNLDGSISFSRFGDAAWPSSAQSSKVAGRDVRYIIAYQKRNRSDAVFRLNFLSRKKGKFFFVCVAKSEGVSGSQTNALSGLLCLVHPAKWSAEIKQIVEDAQDQIDACGQYVPGQGADAYVQNHSQPIYDAVTSALVSRADFTCRFTLNKNGEATLVPPEKWTGHEQCDSDEKKEEQQYKVCSHLFYFLRDLGHRHQHHSPNTDNITLLYPKGDDKLWKYEVFRRIYLKMTDYEWQKKETVYFSCLGLLSYVRSFNRIFREDLKEFDLVRQAIIPLRNMELSIEASYQTMSQLMRSRQAAADNFRGVTIGLVGLVLSFASLSQLIKTGVLSIGEVSSQIKYLDRFMLTQPFDFVSILFAVVVYGWLVVHRASIKDTKFVFELVRAVQGLPKWVSVLFLALLSVVYGCVCYGAYELVRFGVDLVRSLF
jgi:hypothetical protein